MRAVTIGFACLVALCLIGSGTAIVVESSTAAPTPEASPSVSEAAGSLTSEPAADSEVAALRAQLEVMRQYDERLLQTVYWALGTALALVLFAAGAGWYINFRLYDRDKQALLAELRLELETGTAGIRESLSQNLGEARTSLEDAVTLLSKNLREEANLRSEKIEEKALQAGKDAADSLRGELEHVRIDIIRMRYDLSVRKAETWRSEGVYVNELREYMNALSLARQLAEFQSPYEYLVEQALEGMQRALQAGAPLGARELAQMKELIDALPSKYSIQSDRLRGLVSPTRG